MTTFPSIEMTLRVRYHECDPQGIVFNAHYLAYFDMAVGELWRELYGAYENVTAEGVDTVVAESRIQFLAAARYDDVLIVRATVERLGNTAFVIGLHVRRDSEEIATGTLRYVFVDAQTLRKTPPPETIRRVLQPT